MKFNKVETIKQVNRIHCDGYQENPTLVFCCSQTLIMHYSYVVKPVSAPVYDQ